MLDYQKAFIQFALDRGVLRFGEFKLKSGRISPYFFNAGGFQSGGDLSQLGDFYAAALSHSALQPDVIFGPAYKGIPLASATSIALYRNQGLDLPYVFNRKEVKDHGEGGQLVGAPLVGQTLIIDDVITAGTAIREVVNILTQHPQAQLCGVLVALDRQERGQGELSAIQEVAHDFGIPVFAIITLADLINFIATDPQFQHYLPAVSAYRDEYVV